MAVDLDHAALDGIGAHYGLRFIVLFGSRATGSPAPTPESDTDIAVLGCHRAVWLDLLTELQKAAGCTEIDAVRLENADPLFRHEVMSLGILLWGDGDDFANYRAYAYRDFIDSADLRRLERRLMERKMELIRRELGCSGMN